MDNKNLKINIHQPSKESLNNLNNLNNNINGNNNTIIDEQTPRTILSTEDITQGPTHTYDSILINKSNNNNYQNQSMNNNNNHLHPRSHSQNGSILNSKQPPPKQQHINVFNDLINKQSSDYRDIKFKDKINSQNQSTNNTTANTTTITKNFINNVSFDDMNRRFDDDSEPDSDDDIGWDLYNIKRGIVKPKEFKSQQIDINSYLSIGGSTSATINNGNNGTRRNSINPEEIKYPKKPSLDPEEIKYPRRTSLNPEEIKYPRRTSLSPEEIKYPRRTSLNPEEIKYPRRNSTNNNDLDLPTNSNSTNSKLNYNLYQTIPITNLRSYSISKKHKLYDKLYNNEILPNLPILPNRTILIYISSRIHTWVALDWILTKFIENGDKIIIVSTIDPNIFENNNKKCKNKKRRKSSTTPLNNDVSIDEMEFDSPIDRYNYKSLPENLIHITKNLMKYILNIINPNLIVEFTVELVAGKTKQVLKDMFKLYEPNLMCIGAKHNRYVGEPISTFITSKLSGRLIKIFPLPVIVVPAVNMNEFENNLKNQINGETGDSKVENENKDKKTDDNLNSKRSRSISSITSESISNSSNSDEINSIASSLSCNSNSNTNSNEQPIPYDSTTIISEKYNEYKIHLNLKINEIKKDSSFANDENYYSNLISTISDNSLNLCNSLLVLKPNILENYESCKIAKLITGSSLFDNDKIYSTKSLLDPVVEKKKVINIPKEHKMSFKEVREQLKQQQLQQKLQEQQDQQQQQQQQQEEEDQALQSPIEDSTNQTSLKWSLGLEKPIRNYTTTNRDLSNGSSSIKSLGLGSGSGDNLSKNSTNSNEDINLLNSEEIINNAGQINNNQNNDLKIKKKKSKKFWKLFGK
ncbi:uncharacterized protein KGF55_002298 [Candida pseudojiufengensis]|uniref:uncharacterized protein n=1 Tax=Candida pseudojiufengensis TaxID=497109 RepID=UPI002224D9D9|nr:uncharacterized protein KGF55_002298 [Candida pseudojiufengensis]KAI5964356.1 hypothetical protein KGF55_002298 [Candida pseudojiufengensis]